MGNRCSRRQREPCRCRRSGAISPTFPCFAPLAFAACRRALHALGLERNLCGVGTTATLRRLSPSLRSQPRRSNDVATRLPSTRQLSLAQPPGTSLAVASTAGSRFGNGSHLFALLPEWDPSPLSPALDARLEYLRS